MWKRSFFRNNRAVFILRGRNSSETSESAMDGQRKDWNYRFSKTITRSFITLLDMLQFSCEKGNTRKQLFYIFCSETLFLVNSDSYVA